MHAVLTPRHGGRRRGPASLAAKLALPVAVFACAFAPGTALAASVVNGSFETGTFSGWTVNDAGSGNWLINNGGAGNAMAPTDGTRDAYTQQFGPGSHVLYQDIVLEANQRHQLTLDLGYRNNAGRFSTPDSLDHNVFPNQQARVDIVRPAAPVRSVAAADVLLRAFRTEVGTPTTRTMAPVSADLSAFAGQTVRLRIAQVDNQSYFNLTLDKVRIASVPVDADGDGVTDATDNCPAAANADQADLDLDDEGDACDGDIDGDGALNGDDFAPRDAGEQRDSDGDGVGDNADAFPNDAAETVDTDEDGVGDNGDNCRTDANADQADLDADREGDACDADVDGDGAANGDDAFPRDAAESKDSDGDGIGDNADRFPFDATETTDADDDGVGDRADNCRTDANADQADLDADGKGDVCDDDVDGDGVLNAVDNAPRDANADQQDLDKDGVGDVIDTKVLPLSADMCKKEGFKRFYDGAARFKNQGDCVSFVSTGGRNLPAGS